jgi:1-acyl-sn-glycerol-3-phosphate acyltransferase
MPEARIIPINTDGASRRPPNTDGTPRRSTDKPSAARPSTGKPDKASQPAPNGRAAKPAKQTPPPAKPEPDVQPPETLRDMGSFVTGKSDAPRPESEKQPPKEPKKSAAEAPKPPAAEAPGGGEDIWDKRIAGALAFVRRRLTGEYEVDEFGFDADLTESVIAAPLRPLYEKWFRVEVSGMENVPDKGAALIVANHSGVIALDGAITALALLDHHPARRNLRMLGADLVFQTPFLGELARKAGNTLACQADAERLLSNGELVGVYPEGFKGVGKPFSERYKLQRFGRGGFVASALKTKAPIIPCSIVGAEEIYPMLGNAKLLARLLGMPYFPLTPTFPWLGPLGAIPLPSKWYIEFGEPIDTAPLADRADDPMLVFNVADQVRETIQQTLYRLLMKRKSVFL